MVVQVDRSGKQVAMQRIVAGNGGDVIPSQNGFTWFGTGVAVGKVGGASRVAVVVGYKQWRDDRGSGCRWASCDICRGDGSGRRIAWIEWRCRVAVGDVDGDAVADVVVGDYHLQRRDGGE